MLDSKMHPLDEGQRETKERGRLPQVGRWQFCSKENYIQGLSWNIFCTHQPEF